MHEMGHALGLGDSYAADDRDDLMYGWLFIGERRLPGRARPTARSPARSPARSSSAAPVNIGTLPAGKTVTIQWQATIDPQTNQLIVNPVNTGTVTATNAVRLPRHQHATPSPPTLDTLILGGTIWNDNGAGGGIAANGIKDGDRAGRRRRHAVAVRRRQRHDGRAGHAGDTARSRRRRPRQRQLLLHRAGARQLHRARRPGQFRRGGDASLVGLPISRLTSPEHPDPDDNVDNDDNGSRVAGQPAFSKAITLAYNTEPTAGTGNDTNNTLDFGFFNNPPPVLTDLAGDTSTFTEDGPAVLLDDRRRPRPSPTTRPISTAAT